MGLLVGIDFGTTNTIISVLRNGKPVILENDLGNRLTPSVVGISDGGEIIVGEIAKNELLRNPDNTVTEVKRKIGSDKKILVNKKEYLPQEIAAFILKHIKETVEKRLGEQIDEAIITVPAAFNNIQRNATKDAGELAGLKVERIINEPTAAALSYGVEILDDEEVILVYDLGGGTFDVSILEVDQGLFEVKASLGDSNLGGTDFDQRLLDFIIERFKKENNIDLNNYPESLKKIRPQVEETKKLLSSREYSDFIVPFIEGVMDEKNLPIGIDYRISREEFENLIREDVEKTLSIMNQAIVNAGLNRSEIDKVIVVGGSTRVSLVKNSLEGIFHEKVSYVSNPDEAIAMGAAVQAGIKSGEFQGENDYIITDVAPHSLGIEVLSNIEGIPLPGMFSVIIQKDSTIPRNDKERYGTVSDNQERIAVNIYQGEEVRVKDNLLIASFEIDDIPKGPAGSVEVEVEFNYDLNGTLVVKTLIINTGKEYIHTYMGVGMTEKDKKKSKLNIEEDWKKSKLASRVIGIISSAESKLSQLDEGNRIQVEKLIEELKAAVFDNNEALVDRLDEALTDILFDLLDW